jgi:hypothetical protein
MSKRTTLPRSFFEFLDLVERNEIKDPGVIRLEIDERDGTILQFDYPVRASVKPVPMPHEIRQPAAQAMVLALKKIEIAERKRAHEAQSRSEAGQFAEAS